MSLDDNLGPIINDAHFFKPLFEGLSGKLTYGHLNCQSIRPSRFNNKIDELRSLLVGSGISIFGVTESWLNSAVSSKSLVVPGYKLVRSDRVGRVGGGVCLYIGSGIPYKVVFRSNNFGVCESVCVELNIGALVLLVAVVYLPHGDVQSFCDVHESLFDRFSNIIVLGDFNCNLFVSSNSVSMRGLCRSLGLTIVHNMKPTHYDLAHNSTSLIDFCLTSDNLSLGFSSQGRCPGISHHAFVFGSLNLPVFSEERFIEYRNFGRADWLGIVNFISDFDFNPLYSTSDVNCQLSLFDLLFNALLSFVPVSVRKVNPRNDAWLESDVVKSARMFRDLAYFEWRKRPMEGNRIIYCMYRNRCKAVMRNERRKYYNDLFGRMNNNQLWKSLKSFGVLGSDNEAPPIDVNAANHYFSSGNPGFVGERGQSLYSEGHVGDDVFRFYCIFYSDVVRSLNKVKSGAVGVDGVPVKFFKLIFPYISCHFLHFVNSIFMTSTFPRAWKVARIVPVPKTGESFDLPNLRPISILPAMSKIVEHIIKEAIVDFLDDRRLLSSSQFGFRRRCSTTTHLLYLTDMIRDVFNSSDVGLLLGLDLSKAFDLINHSLLLDKLRFKFGFSSSACRLMASYLEGRSQFVVHLGVSSEVCSVQCGVPQGSVLGPLLFIMFINDIVHSVVDDRCCLFLYADDIHVFFREADIAGLEGLVNSIVLSLSSWISLNGLMINWNKTKAMLFNDHGNGGSLNITVGSVLVKFVDEMKCLGVIIDRKLDFKRHIDSLLCRIRFQLRRLYCLNAYLPCHVRKRVVVSLLLSQVNYCLEVVSGTTSSQMQRIRRAVNSIVRYVYGLRRGDHVSCFVNDLLGLPFSSYVDLRILQFHYSVMCNFDSPLRDNFVFCRSSRNPQLLCPRFSSSIGERSFVVRAVRLWNQLPLALRTFAHTNYLFRVKVIEYLRLNM
ncbi:uncharacterized protein LOC131804754 isoform X1 [Musca domestica]|uniref:Uncharacterized protein LOC131804754 isoform X1 n=1 Tax=Musca domestica TaxID=7370 RepID=A0ABM3VDM0_MUSDO|nr:uncharacterized protein LOC131804754 isoform X1 [Musca domestica]XP_058983891.1 uncharacterized protein LOC131804754 isoform X1 [Musca domestica]